MQTGAGGGSAMEAGGALPDWDAVGGGGGLGGLATVDAGEGWASAVAEGETAVQAGAGAGAGEGGAARALGPGREAGLRASEAWGEPLSVGAGGLRPEPGWGRLPGSNEGRGAGGRMAVPVAGTEGVLGGWAKADQGCWVQGVGGPCSCPGSSLDCALGLTP